jgi:predicted AlkP superfamily phosphohydrolase/phosphomutase
VALYPNKVAEYSDKVPEYFNKMTLYFGIINQVITKAKVVF